MNHTRTLATQIDATHEIAAILRFAATRGIPSIDWIIGRDGDIQGQLHGDHDTQTRLIADWAAALGIRLPKPTTADGWTSINIKHQLGDGPAFQINAAWENDRQD